MITFDEMWGCWLNNAKELIKEKKLTQRMVAKELGMEESNFSLALNGKKSRSEYFLYRIAEVLKVHPARIFNLEVK